MSLRAVFLDREGVITPKLAKGEFILKTEQLLLNPNAVNGLRRLIDRGYKLFIVSNQSCVSRGMISYEEVDRLHALLLNKLSENGITFEDSRICPHVDSDECNCRKPKPGMILDLCEKYGIDPKDTAMVGDSSTDLQAGKSAGCSACIYISEQPQLEVVTCKDLSEVADWIINSKL